MPRRQLAAEYIPKLLRDWNASEGSPIPELLLTEAANRSGHVYPIVQRAIATLVRDGDIKRVIRPYQDEIRDYGETVYWI